MAACFEDLKTNDYLGLQLPKIHAESANFSINNRYLLCYPAEPNPHYIFITIAAINDYHLFPKINSIVQRLMENGLVQRIIKESRPKKSEDEPRERSFILAAFGFLRIGAVISTVVFMLEWLAVYIKKRFGANRCWYIIHHSIEGCEDLIVSLSQKVPISMR